MNTLLDWLEQLGLGRYAPVFAEHEISLEVLPHLTEADLDRLRLPTGPRRRVLIALQVLQDAARTQPQTEGGAAPVALPRAELD